MRVNRVDALVIGGGPAGLAAATRLGRLGVGEVVVLEREAVAGGVPRHCPHPSFGLREFGRPMTGPRYASVLRSRTEKASVMTRTETTVLEVGSPAPYVVSTSPRGLERWEVGAVVLATGCRERSRPARLIAGTRAAGVFTTGELQQFTYLHDVRVGNRAVVVGAEHVSFSAVMTLRHARIECAAMLTEFADHQSYGLLRMWATRLGRVPLLAGHRLVSIEGHRRVESVVVEGPGGQQRIACDTVILSGEWVAEGSLALSAGLSSDTKNGGRPEVTAGGATSVPGVFAAGTLISPGESSASATRSGLLAADAVAAFLGRSPETGPSHDLRLDWAGPIRWVSPQRVNRDDAVVFKLRVDRWMDRPTLVFSADGAVLNTVDIRRLVPGRTYTFDGSWLGGLGPGAAEVQISIGVGS